MAGEVFYLTVYQGSQLYTEKYRVVSQDPESDPTLDLSREESWENIQLPINKFQVYSLEDDKWKEQS
jgi:hypothetical protein